MLTDKDNEIAINEMERRNKTRLTRSITRDNEPIRVRVVEPVIAALSLRSSQGTALSVGSCAMVAKGIITAEPLCARISFPPFMRGTLVNLASGHALTYSHACLCIYLPMAEAEMSAGFGLYLPCPFTLWL